MSQPVSKILAVIGCGGIGLQIARRLGRGHHILVADYSDSIMNTALTTLRNEGFSADGTLVDITDYRATCNLAAKWATLGKLSVIVHAAGVSPATATAKQVFDIDLLGTAHVIDAFCPVVSAGSSLTCISSMAGHLFHPSPALEKHLATAPIDQLLDHDELNVERGFSYLVAKRGNQLRVQFAAQAYGAKGARINSISPGVTDTSMIQSELVAEENAGVRDIIEASTTKRMAKPEEIANVVAFLASSDASFITGTDILVDSGAAAGLKWHSTPV